MAQRRQGQRQSRESGNARNGEDGVKDNLFAYITAILVCLASEGAIFYFFISDCGDLFTNSSEYPFISV